MSEAATATFPSQPGHYMIATGGKMGRIAMLIVGVLLLPSALLVEAAAAGPHTVFISISDTSVAVGQKVRIDGRVLPEHSRPLRLQVKHTGAWRGIARTMTTNAGRYSFADTPSKAGDRYYRVCKIGGSRVCSQAKLVHVRSGHPKTQPTITVREVVSYDLTTDENFDISGSASQDLVGEKVYLQMLNSADSSWASISDSVAIESDGSFHLVVPARQTGRDLKLRILAPATLTTKPAHADLDPFTVYGWVYVDKLQWVEGAWGEGSAAVNGVSYPRSIYTSFDWSTSGTKSGAVDLGRKCKTLTATVGLRDDSNTSVRFSISVTADSTEVSRIDNVGLGQSTPISVDITGILRLAFSATKTTSRDEGSPVYGDARVLCAF